MTGFCSTSMIDDGGRSERGHTYLEAMQEYGITLGNEEFRLATAGEENWIVVKLTLKN